MLKLECPHCHVTFVVSEWNKNVKESVSVGVAEELIPETMNDPNEWDTYRETRYGRVDCPECGEVCVFDDMEAY